MDNPGVFARQSNTAAGHNRAPEARSAGREGLEQPDRVLYVYDRVSTKNDMQHRMKNTPMPHRGSDLSGIYKKKAHIHTDMNRNLKEFYASAKTGGRRTVHMGKVVDESAFIPPQPKTNRVPSDFSTTQVFEDSKSAAGVGSIPHKQKYAAFERQDEGQTRMFSTPAGSPGSGGAAVKKHRKLWMEGLVNLFETLEERWQRDVDTAKKQALLHKKLQEHRRGLTLALVILLVFGICCGAIYELLFVVRSVDAVGSDLYTPGEVITAAGFSEDTNLYDFKAEDITERITFYCPYIRSAELTRHMPSTVSLVLEDDEPVYCANIFGEIVALSAGLRVLGTLTAEETDGFILIRLPAVTEAVAGRPLVFADARNERYIRQVLEDTALSELSGRISYMDLRDSQDLIMYCDGMYELQLGNSADLMMKLRMGNKSISDVMFPQNTPARINLSVVGEASVRADLRLDLTVNP